VGIGAGIWYWGNKEAEKLGEDLATNPPVPGGPIGPGGVPVDPEAVFGWTPKDTDEAVAGLRSPERGRRIGAGSRLAKQPRNQARQREVAHALDPLVSDAGSDTFDAGMDALKVWGDKDSAPHVAKHLPAQPFWKADRAKSTLQGMGAEASEAEALKYLFHPEAQGRARDLLTAFGTRTDVLLTQAVTDLRSVDAGRRRAAADWLAKALPNQARRTEGS